MTTTLQTVPACAETFTLVPASWVAVVYGKGGVAKVTATGCRSCCSMVGQEPLRTTWNHSLSD